MKFANSNTNEYQESSFGCGDIKAPIMFKMLDPLHLTAL
jgi:hypothetical protein